ncbi:MAG: hypothetical protein DCF16_16465 [Alphaproteobacteria bacterium]|nr:MAG: hypothetical protein DCF16_16465 [Alphaproteobacteria bacterium]
MNDKTDPGIFRRKEITGLAFYVVAAGLLAADVLYGRDGAWRFVDFVRVGAILFLALVLALRSTTAFSLWRRNRTLDDELTRANRAAAARWGFWALMLALLVAFIASFAVALRISDVVPLIFFAGAAAAGLRFVTLERRAE